MSKWTDFRDGAYDVVDGAGIIPGHGSWFGDTGIGDKLYGSGGKNNYQATNPGEADLSKSNPELWAQIQLQKGMQSDFHNSSMNAMDPARYAARSQEAQARASNATMNRFGSMGLAGTSAAMGTANEQSRQIGMQWQDRQLSDQIRSMQMEQQLSQGVTRNLLAGQAQFGSYQNMLMNRDAQAAAADAAMWGAIFGGLGTVGGAAAGGAFGGPAGATVGSKAGGSLGQAAAYGSMGSPTYMPSSYDSSYTMPELGDSMYNPNF